MNFFRTRTVSLLLLFTLIVPFWGRAEERNPSGVTYGFSGGRFGDNLLSFAHALWFSHTLQIPLVYKPFPYSDQLAMHDHPDFIKHEAVAFNKQHRIHTTADYLQFFGMLNSDSFDGVLLEVPFYPESSYLYDNNKTRAQFTQANWQDPEFRELLNVYIKPNNNQFARLVLPNDRITAALHYRSGVGFDKPKSYRKFPLKFPPDSFYIDALNYLQQAASKPLYIFVFTDHPNPEEVKEKFQLLFSASDMLFDCRKGPSRQDLNVLEDFFSLGDFDCLIRPDSNFSVMASLLFDYDIIISPTHFRKENDNVIVDHLLLEFGSGNLVKKPICTILRKP